jgi:hypothetical protein
LKGKFSTVEIGFSGFCEGSAKALIHTPELIENILK